MKKLLMMCSVLAIIASSSNAASRAVIVTHVQERGFECTNSYNSNLLGSMMLGAMFGKIMTGNDKGAFAGALLGTTINNGSNNKVCKRIQKVFWQTQSSSGRSYRGSFITNKLDPVTEKPYYVSQTIYVHGLP